MRKWLFLLILIPVFGLSQHNLTVTVEGVKSSVGNISIGLYNKVEGFLTPEEGFLGISVKAIKGTTTALIENLPYGSYAIAVFHDENGNQGHGYEFFRDSQGSPGIFKRKAKNLWPSEFWRMCLPVQRGYGRSKSRLNNNIRQQINLFHRIKIQHPFCPKWPYLVLITFAANFPVWYFWLR